MDIESLRAHTSARPAPFAEAIARLSTRAMDISSDVHCLSHDLHSPTLELVGLPEGIARLCRDVSSRFLVRIDFRQGHERPRVSADAALCLFRVAQEALQNVVKHSGARAATVHLTQARHHIRLDIADVGKGFVTGGSRAGAGLGLLSMRERVLTAGGRIAIQSAQGQGTRVTVTLPTAASLSARQMS
jgi:signal transduction histidine kinase